MNTSETKLDALRESVIALGQAFYDERLKDLLEPAERGRYVAIEPQSGRYFVGDTSAEVLGVAHDEMPDCRFYLTRVGQRAAHSIGGRGLYRTA